MANKNGWGKEFEGTVQLRGEIYEKRNGWTGEMTKMLQTEYSRGWLRETVTTQGLYAGYSLLPVTQVFGGHMDVNC